MNLGSYIKDKKITQAGFTLFEFLVSISIFIIMTSIMVFNHTRFNSDILVTDLAYQIALSVREAQVYGTSRQAIGSGADSDIGYGIYIERGSDSPYSAYSYIFFVDDNGNLTYDSGETILNRYNLTRGNKIYNVCIFPTPTSQKCFISNVTGGISSLKSASIVFLRPDPDARISGVSSMVNTGMVKAIITVASSDNSIKKYIKIESTGQISVTNQL